MLEDIQKVREKTSELIREIYDLKDRISKEKKARDQERNDIFLRLIDKLEAAQEQNQTIVVETLQEVLNSLGVVKLDAPINKIKDYTLTIRTSKDETLPEGTVLEVLKDGYIQKENIVRPTHVVAVKNT